jgi:hypothetical protein
VRVAGRDILLRPGRISDGPAWRTTRLRDEKRLRAAFGHPDRPWDEDCSLIAWTEHVMGQRRAIRAGELQAFLALTTDGQVLGEFSFLIEPRSGAAECSMWTTRALPSEVTRWISAESTLRVLEQPRHVPWVIAPVAAVNPAPGTLLRLAGYEPISTSRLLRPYAGVPTDHVIWRLENTPEIRRHLHEISRQCPDSA